MYSNDSSKLKLYFSFRLISNPYIPLNKTIGEITLGQGTSISILSKFGKGLITSIGLAKLVPKNDYAFQQILPITSA